MSLDVRDVLNISQDGSAPRPSKKQKISAPRPNLKGLAREVQNLGGDNPIAIVPAVSNFKKRRFISRKPAERWELKQFSNSAREDSTLVLRHWRRRTQAPAPVDEPMANGDAEPVKKDEPDVEDSGFAKFNVQVSIPQYSEEQYESSLKNSDWTKEETDYLLELVKAFDIRWPIVWDRYDYKAESSAGVPAEEASTAVALPSKARTMEDLKARYYEVAAKMMAAQKPVQYMTHQEYKLHEIMSTFNPEHERARKAFAINSMSRSKEEAREEESLLLEVKRIIARQERMNEERRELYARLDYPHTDQDINQFKTSAGLQTLLQNLMNADKSKKRKSLMGPDGVSPVAGGAVGGQSGSAGAEPGHARRDSIATSVTGHRDSIGAAGERTPIEPVKNNKKGAPAAERRKLTEREEQLYGLSHHDRLGSGATFRYEKVNKLFASKSGQAQQRISNVLTELDVPPRLVMPTTAVAGHFETLMTAVVNLLDQRKLADKLDGEIKIEEAKRAEKLKARGLAVPGDGATEDDSKTGGDAPAAAESGDAAAAETPSVAAVLNGEAVTTTEVPIKEEDTEKTARPGSSSAHKRSASVLSTTSDKSSKRQKKG